MAMRHVLSGNHSGMPPSLQHVVRPLVSLGRSAPRAGVPHAVVFTDASATGWGATYNRHAVSGVWTGPQLHWHINCLELLAVRLALGRLKGLLRGKHVLVRTDNTATVAFINHQGGLHSRRMSQLARHLLLWSQKHLRSLRTVHVPGVLNRVAVFPELMLLATLPPWQIPLKKDLLSQRRRTLWHPHPDLWKLHAWSLEGTWRF